MLKLYIGNKNYSSWSMRPWVLLTEFGLRPECQVLRFDTPMRVKPHGLTPPVA